MALPNCAPVRVTTPLSLPLAPARHGRIAEHYDAMLGHSHVALFAGAPRIVPSFRVADLDAALAAAEARGATRALDLSEGNRTRYFRALAMRYSASAATGPPLSARSRRTSSRTARRISSGSAASAWPVEPPPRSKGP